MSIADFLGLNRTKDYRKTEPVPAVVSGPAEPTADTETVRKIVAALDKLEPERARFIAAFAYILCRVARADLNISPAETQLMEQVLIQRAELPEEHAVLIVQMAKTQSILFGGTENFVVTREFNKIATREQKLALLDCLFAVSADEMISSVEDTEIRQIASELQLTHDDLVSVRSAYREQRAVMRPPPPKP